VHSQGWQAGPSHGDKYVSCPYNQNVEPSIPPVQFAHEGVTAVPADLDRTAGFITLVGCSITFLAFVMPWLEETAFGVSVPALGTHAAGIPLAFLTIVSAGIAGVVLFRGPATPKVAITLVVSAALQLGLAIWFGSSIVLAIEQANSHLVLISAIGTGAYMSVLGSTLTLVGGVLAWTGRALKTSVRS
jgi:hypothetical protein